MVSLSVYLTERERDRDREFCLKRLFRMTRACCIYSMAYVDGWSDLSVLVLTFIFRLLRRSMLKIILLCLHFSLNAGQSLKGSAVTTD